MINLNGFFNPNQLVIVSLESTFPLMDNKCSVDQNYKGIPLTQSPELVNYYLKHSNNNWNYVSGTSIVDV